MEMDSRNDSPLTFLQEDFRENDRAPTIVVIVYAFFIASSDERVDL